MHPIFRSTTHHTKLTGHRRKAPDEDLVLRVHGNALANIPTPAVEVGFAEGLADLREDAKRLLLGTNGGIAVVVLVNYAYCLGPRDLPTESWVEVWKFNVHGVPYRSVTRVIVQLLSWISIGAY